MDNANDRKLSFPQRNWFLICLLVAIISPLVVHLLQRGADKESYRESSHIKPVDAANATDTSYKVASPAGAGDTSKKAGAAGDSAGK